MSTINIFYKTLRFLAYLCSVLFTSSVIMACSIGAIFWYFGANLPSSDCLETYKPFEKTSLYASNKSLITEYALQYRQFVRLEDIPKKVINAFLVAEDKNFYQHHGIDLSGILFAFLKNTVTQTWQNKPNGGSTITQQLAKNLLVGNEKSFVRKIREAIMAIRLEYGLSKDRILELYLNQIYLGMGVYGVKAAAKYYFNKSLYDLDYGEAAFLASLPKAPSYLQIANKNLPRRNWILKRLWAEGYINKVELNTHLTKKFQVSYYNTVQDDDNMYFSETVKKELLLNYGEEAIYQGGYAVITTMDKKLQKIASRILSNSLVELDKKYSKWDGPIHKINAKFCQNNQWLEQLKKLVPIALPFNWTIGVIIEQYSLTKYKVGLLNGATAELEINGWENINLFTGDVVWAQPVGNIYHLVHIPKITGGIVILDAESGKLLAISGGFNQKINQFNCATQALRQPGSSFKPFIYLTALENGFYPSSKVLDAPITLKVGDDFYRPKNMSGITHGMTSLQDGLAYSYNLITVRLGMHVGLKKIAETAKKFGIYDNMPLRPSMLLGAGETTLLNITNAYAAIINNGKKFPVKYVENIYDSHGKSILNFPKYNLLPNIKNSDGNDVKEKSWEIVADVNKIHQLQNMLRCVIQYGTGKKLLYLLDKYNIDLIGKTGTTNKCSDAWFVGGISNINLPSVTYKKLAVGIFVGYKNPRPIGKNVSGSTIALPIFEKIVHAIFDINL